MPDIKFSTDPETALIQGFNILSEWIEAAYACEWPYKCPAGQGGYKQLYEIMGHMVNWAKRLSHEAIDKDSSARDVLIEKIGSLFTIFSNLDQSVPQDDKRTLDEIGRDMALQMFSGESRLEEMRPFIQMAQDIEEVSALFGWEDEIETSDVTLLLDEE